MEKVPQLPGDHHAKEIERNLNVCPKCDYHFRISARERIALIIDESSLCRDGRGDEIRRLSRIQGQ
ncbi:MAG: hypothetical protein R2864_09975 [Syntrophotaleaceae bacterium]